MDRLAQDEARAIDGFYSSDLDEMYLIGSQLLPQPSCSLAIDGHSLCIKDQNGKEHRAVL